MLINEFREFYLPQKPADTKIKTQSDLRHDISFVWRKRERLKSVTYLKNKVLCKLVVCVTSSKMEESGRHGEPNIFSPKPLTLTSSKGESSI